MSDLTERLRALGADDELIREVKVLGLKAGTHDRLPFCADHRDKVAGRPCRECEIEQLRSGLRIALGAFDKLRGASGPRVRAIAERSAQLIRTHYLTEDQP